MDRTAWRVRSVTTGAADARSLAAALALMLLLATAAVVLGFPSVAEAHVEVEPGSVEGGDFAVVAFRVPNERQDAQVTQLRVLLPKDSPLASVQTTPVAGWRQSVKTRKLATPVDLEGVQITSVVSEVRWNATTGGIRPGQFQDFQVSLGQLPESGRLVFTAVQTYSTGERVLWNEVAADGAAEPEHPAPALDITAAEPAGTQVAANSVSPAATPVPGSRTSRAAIAADRSPTAVVLMSATALVLALAAVVLGGLAWRRRNAP